jgi:hypothetical protein
MALVAKAQPAHNQNRRGYHGGLSSIMRIVSAGIMWLQPAWHQWRNRGNNHHLRAGGWRNRRISSAYQPAAGGIAWQPAGAHLGGGVLRTCGQ